MTMTAIQAATNCCGSAASHSCATERTRFFPGQMVGPDDFSQDQDYFRARMRRHNRLLHGWGIVCGASVAQTKKPCEVVVSSGFILGPQGDEILIEGDTTVNLCAEDIDGNAPNDCVPADPWCSDVQVTRPANTTLYLAIRYAECPSRPVRSSGCGCGCNGGDCEYSRIRDGFVIKVLSAPPASYNGIKAPNTNTVFACGAAGSRICPPCPTDPWVILTDFTVAADGKTITSMGKANLRRYVASFASFFMLCP
jgi:hypothetical protein